MNNPMITTTKARVEEVKGLIRDCRTSVAKAKTRLTTTPLDSLEEVAIQEEIMKTEAFIRGCTTTLYLLVDKYEVGPIGENPR